MENFRISKGCQAEIRIAILKASVPAHKICGFHASMEKETGKDITLTDIMDQKKNLLICQPSFCTLLFVKLQYGKASTGQKLTKLARLSKALVYM